MKIMKCCKKIMMYIEYEELMGILSMHIFRSIWFSILIKSTYYWTINMNHMKNNQIISIILKITIKRKIKFMIQCNWLRVI